MIDGKLICWACAAMLGYDVIACSSGFVTLPSLQDRVFFDLRAAGMILIAYWQTRKVPA